MRIAIDFDDVIANTIDEFLVGLNRAQRLLTHRAWIKEDFTQWGIAEITGLSEYTIKALFNTLNYDNVEEIGGAVAGILGLLLDGHEVTVLTANRRKVSITDWLASHGLPSLAVYVTSDKVEFCCDFDFDVLIDDNPDTLCEASDTLELNAIRFAKPWNAMMVWGGEDNEHTAHNWYQVREILRRLASHDRIHDVLAKASSLPLEGVTKGIDAKHLPNLVAFLDSTLEEIETNASGAKQSRIDGRFDLLPMRALKSVSRVLKEGAEKYGIDNWRGLSVDEINNHVWAHLADYQLTGELEDLEHSACRMLMALEIALGGGNE